MADRYWVGGTGTWGAGATTNWSASSGGASGASQPTSADNVFFNGSSGGGTCTLGTGTLACADFVATGYTGTITGSTRTIGFYGTTITFGSGMTFGPVSILDFRSTGSCSITTNGISLTVNSLLRILAAGTFTLQDDLTIITGRLSFQSTGHTFDANNHDIVCAGIANAAAGTVNMGSGTWTLNGAGSSGSIWSTHTSETINAGTSTVHLTGTYATAQAFEGDGKTWYNLNVDQASGTLDIEGSSTFNNITIQPGKTVHFQDGTTQTVSSFTASGTVSDGITLTGTSTAGWSISDTSGTNSVTYCTISYSTATGGATWESLTDDGNVNGGSNTGWIFNYFTPSPMMHMMGASGGLM